MMKISIFVICVCLAITAFSVTYNLGLSPLKTEAEMYPGDIQTFELNLVNGTLADINYQLDIGTFTLDKSGAYVYLTKDSTYTFSCANWIKFPNNQTSINVRALQTEKIQVSIEVPRSVKYGGDYYAMIWANFVPKDTLTSAEATGTGISIERRFRFGSIVHITVKGRPANSKLTLDRIEILNLDEIATSTQRGLRISAIVKNSGDTSFRPAGDYLIVSSDNKVWGRGDLTMDHTDLVMPNIEREIYALYDRSLPVGEYTVKINIKSGNKFLNHKEQNFSIVESASTSKPLEVNVLLSPSDITGDVKAGTNQMGKFELSNREFSTISATIDAVTLGMDENGYWVFGSDDIEDIKFYPDVFNLREDQKRVIPFSYKIPQEATGLYAFAAKVRVSIENSPNISIFYIPVMMRISGTTKYGFEITNTEKIMPSTPTDKAFLRVWIKNTGNTFTNFNIIYDIVDSQMNYLTLQAQYLSENGFTIFPSVERYVDIPIGNYKINKTGVYHVPMIITYKGDKNSNQQIKTEVAFEITQDDLVSMGSVQS